MLIGCPIKACRKRCRKSVACPSPGSLPRACRKCCRESVASLSSYFSREPIPELVGGSLSRKQVLFNHMPQVALESSAIHPGP